MNWIDEKLGVNVLPERVGAYRVISEIGRGGMGVVYEAEQEDPKRRVALKLVASGLASPTLIDRFRREAQALGRLDHPGIAHILEAGTFDAGAGPVPFYAMDLVAGEPITDALAASELHEKLTVLADVADAVHHAHLRGVVHRDIKPANVLVDSEARARVVDFGVARLMDPDPGLDSDTPAAKTIIGNLIGTPSYMSPEQATGNPDLVDARSDIYSLGVLAYEVLSSRPPLKTDNRSLDEQLRAVREETPRQLGPAEGVPHDVGVVLAMALEKDPSRRHASAAALADDLRRARDGHPVSGRAPSSWYQLRRLAGRHPFASALAGVSLALLIAGTTLIAVLLGRSVEAERRAASEARIARSVTDFLVEDVFGSVSPDQRDTETLTVDQLVDNAAADAETRFAGDPEVARDVLRALAEVDLRLGRYADARERVARIDAMSAALPAPDADDAAALSRAEALERVRAKVAGYMDDLDTSIELFDRLLAGRVARLGPDHPDTLDMAVSRAGVLVRKDFDTGTQTMRALIEQHERVFGPEDPRTIELMDDMALNFSMEGRFEDGLPYALRVAEVRPKLAGPNAWNTVLSRVNLGEIYRGLGQFDEAMANFNLAREGFEARGTPQTSFHRISLDGNMGLVQMNAGNFEAAEPYLDRAIANGIAAGERGTMAFETLRHNYGALKMLLGLHDEAEATLSDVLVQRRATLGPNDFETLVTLGLMGENRRRAGRIDDAVAPLTGAYDGFAANYGADSDFAQRTAARLVQVHEALGNSAEVDVWKQRAEPGL